MAEFTENETLRFNSSDNLQCLSSKEMANALFTLVLTESDEVQQQPLRT
jgi:hypothetical protein